jgi:hypothetical protein
MLWAWTLTQHLTGYRIRALVIIIIIIIIIIIDSSTALFWALAAFSVS